VTAGGANPFREWLGVPWIVNARAKIRFRWIRLRLGNFGDRQLSRLKALLDSLGLKLAIEPKRVAA